MKPTKLLLLFVPFAFAVMLAIHACKKPATNTPHNPYSDIIRNDTGTHGIPVDPLSITSVHQRVLSTRCALPGCHDGRFEPDYRTAQSSYTTLVYAPIVKNDTLHRYKYRVIPYDTTYSVLYQRITNCCFVNQNDRMPKDSSGRILPDSSLNIIANWILNGARDIYGNINHQPNAEPLIQGYVGLSTNYQTTYSNTRLSGIGYNPFILPDSVSSFYIAVFVTDDSTPVAQLQYNKLKISTHADDFNGGTVLPGTYLAAGGNAVWVFSVNAAALPQNDTLYMRYDVNDGSHLQNTEFPRDDQIYPYKTYWSFIRQ